MNTLKGHNGAEVTPPKSAVRARLSRRSLLTSTAIVGGSIGLAALAGINPGVANAANTRAVSGASGLYATVGILTAAPYWNGPKAAFKRAEKDMGITTSFNGTTGLNDADLVTIIDQLIPKHPKGLLIEPADPNAVQDVIKRARAAGIPSLIINSGYVPDGNQVGYIGFSRQEAAALAARVVAKNGKTSGTVVAMVFSPSAVAMTDALAGFKAELHKTRPGLKVLEVVDKADVQYSTTLMTQMLNSHKDIVGVVSLDTVGGQAAANAITAVGIKGLTLVAGGLDESQSQYWPLIQSGVVTAGILSSSFEQFYTGLQYLVNLNSKVVDGIDWKKYNDVRVVPKYTDLGSFVITKANLSSVKGLTP